MTTAARSRVSRKPTGNPKVAEYKAQGSLAAMDEEGNGGFSGRASTFGELDSVGDIVLAGAFAGTLGQFKERGFIAWSHNWDSPIGYIVDAEERPDGLWIEAKFHSDAQAQDVRARTRERLAASKNVGLSIGYAIEDFQIVGDIRYLKRIKLYEVSIVAVPAEQNAHVVAVRSQQPVGPTAKGAEAVLDSLSADDPMRWWVEWHLRHRPL